MSSFDEQWQRWFPEGQNTPPARNAKNRERRVRVFPILVGVLVLFLILGMLKGFYTEWLWFNSLGFESVYSTILQTEVLIFIFVTIVVFLVFGGNLWLALHLAPGDKKHGIGRPLTWVVILVTAVIALIFGLTAQGSWPIALRFFNGQPFNVTDPVFNREVGFYVFTLPFLRLIRGWLLGLFFVTFFGSLAVYLFQYLRQRIKFDLALPVLAHMGGLIIALLSMFAWSYWLGIWELVFSKRGAVFGASYADIYANLPAQWILLAVVLVCIVLFIVAIMQRKWLWAVYGIGGWIGIAIIVGAIYPALVQRIQVQPNELALERPYIDYNIQFTREAFALDRIEEQSFPAEKSPTVKDLEQNKMTIGNIRLWDHRPLKDTYNQIQSIRLYYDFYDIDIDRYIIDGEYRQVMLSARELSAEKLAGQAQTWVNRQLQFTHGYGFVLSPVNETTTEGLPVLLAKDIPPAGDFTLMQPQIYFGEKTNHHVIVKTNTQEFDYPMGETNVYGRWEGEGGVSLGTLFRRFLYAWELNDFNILISSELTSESELLYYRNIQERVGHLAPFLTMDKDPYLVVVDGKFYWIQDCYTTTDRYPYSEPYRGINYIRNSVKAVIDAYNGSVTFYVTDPEDALIQTYQSIFPELFVPGEQMPESLQAHLRYPEDMFTIQASKYQAYHMTDARVFYNKEDLWAVPKEVYAGNEQPVDPYYIIMRLPDETKEEFLLMFPFTPVNKNNTIGWLAARCDGENYGKMLAYYFPKERLVYGPSQIENRIQQDTEITEQLALWGRGGSRVIRGNLLLIPLGKSTLYVEPIFLQAEAGGLPELKRVILAAGERIAMRPTLAECIQVVFEIQVPEGESTPQPPAVPTEPQRPGTGDTGNLVQEAQQHYDAAQQYLKEGDWAGYGKELEALKAVLNQLSELTAQEEK